MQLYEMLSPNDPNKNNSINDILINDQELKKWPNAPVLSHARYTTVQSIIDGKNCAGGKLSTIFSAVSVGIFVSVLFLL